MTETIEKNETERRFLTTSQKWRDLRVEKDRLFIKQAYPDYLQDDEVFGRVRCTEHTDMTLEFTGCAKGVSVGLQAPEREGPIPESEFDKGLLLACNQVLTKYRWPIPVGNFLLQVDQFIDIRHKPSRLVITEVEFDGPDALEQANSFSPPDWLGEEISGQHQWSNFSLCMNGEPQDWYK